MGEKHHPNQTTYAKAVREYDQGHERELLDAIAQALLQTSKVSDCDACVIRTGEAAQGP